MSESTNQNVPGGDETNAGSEGSKQNTDSNSDVVPYSSHVKVIDEAKAAKRKAQELQARLAEYEAKAKEIEESKLLEEKNYTELITKYKSDNERLMNEVQSHLKDKEDFRKMNAALGLLQDKGIQLETKYLDLLPIDQIQIDQESGQIDGNSLSSVVEKFQKEHPRLVIPRTKLLPNEASGNSGASKMTVEQWKKLGSPKERNEALAKGLVKF